jgi:hypothetical protein
MLAFFFGFVFDCRLNFSANWGSLASIDEDCPFGFLPTIIFTVIDAFLDLCILDLPLPCVSLYENWPNDKRLKLSDLGAQVTCCSQSPGVRCISTWRICHVRSNRPHGHLHQAEYAIQ